MWTLQLTAYTRKSLRIYFPNQCAALAWKLDNSPTRLLCAVLWLKLNWMFFNQGTQKEACGLFTVHEKQLSRLIMGHKYFGGTDKRKSTDDSGDEKCSKLHHKKSQLAETAVNAPEEDTTGPKEGHSGVKD